MKIESIPVIIDGVAEMPDRVANANLVAGVVDGEETFFFADYELAVRYRSVVVRRHPIPPDETRHFCQGVSMSRRLIDRLKLSPKRLKGAPECRSGQVVLCSVATQSKLSPLFWP